MNISAAGTQTNVNPAMTSPQWNRVEDQLPENNMFKMVLCLASNGTVRIGYLHKGEWRQGTHPSTFKEFGFTITHWMPIPELPRA